MLIQKVIRGVSGLERPEVEAIMQDEGLLCAAIRNKVVDSIDGAERLLSKESVRRHQNDFATYARETPYISTTAGTYVEGGRWRRRNRPMSAFDTALDFAVISRRQNGWIFYGYVFLLGTPAIQHAEFAEELRDLHQHPAWSRYRAEGEIAVAVRIPPRRLRCAELYTYDGVRRRIAKGVRQVPDDCVDNLDAGIYQPPEELLYARGVI